MSAREKSSPARLIMLDLVAFVVMAAAMGLIAAITLAAVTLLFASQAQAGEIREGTLLLRRSESQETIHAPLLSTEVVFRVSGLVLRAHVVQRFENVQDDWVEGVYVFPLPENAAADRLRMRVGERVIEGAIQERGAAKRTYEAAKLSGQRAARLDQERANIFTASVANIGPRETIVVELEYQQTLRYESGRFSMRFPMVVGPRYIPGNVRMAGSPGSGWGHNTERVADAAAITPPVLRPREGAASINPVSLTVELDAGVPLEHVISPYHPVNVEAIDASRRRITLAAGAVLADRDFELQWSPSLGQTPQVAWFTEEKDGRHYGLLMVLPPAAPEAARLPREVIYVIDTSGSMGGASIRQARDALALALARLAPEDQFNVIEFNSEAQALFPQARPADAQTVRRAIEWVRRLEARGGTEMAAALHLALDGRDDVERVRQVVFLTDGAVGNEEALFRLIRSRLGGSRLFTVGIGSAPNSHFMSKAARLGRGTFTYIGRIEEVGARMRELFAKLETPVLQGLEVHWPEPQRVEAWPERVPDLYAGEPVIIKAALSELAGEVRITGVRGGRTWDARVPLAAHRGADGMGTLWAREKVSALLDSIGDGAPEAAVRDEVIRLASAHRLVTRYTSFVAVEATPARPSGMPLKQAALPTHLPQGWEYDKVFGAQGELPQGASGSFFALLSGLLALMLGTLLLAARDRRYA